MCLATVTPMMFRRETCKIEQANGYLAMKGSIRGTEDHHEFHQHKTGHSGVDYSKFFYSPLRQVGTHVWRLSQYLKQHRIDTWIQGVVFFSHPEAEVNVKSQHIPVFSYQGGEESLLHYIVHFGSHGLSEHRQRDIVALIVSTFS